MSLDPDGFGGIWLFSSLDAFSCPQLFELETIDNDIEYNRLIKIHTSTFKKNQLISIK